MKTERMELRVTKGEKAGFDEAANLAGVSLSTWARISLRRAAMQQFQDAGRRLDFQLQGEGPNA